MSMLVDDHGTLPSHLLILLLFFAPFSDQGRGIISSTQKVCLQPSSMPGYDCRMGGEERSKGERMEGSTGIGIEDDGGGDNGRGK